MAAVAALRAEFQPISDMRASAAYRQTVLGNLLQRFWLESQGLQAINLEDKAPATPVVISSRGDAAQKSVHPEPPPVRPEPVEGFTNTVAKASTSSARTEVGAAHPSTGSARTELRAAGVSRHHESARAQVAGGATYIDDIPEVRGTLHAAPICSPVAHGRLRGIDASAALAPSSSARQRAMAREAARCRPAAGPKGEDHASFRP
eukprot:gene61698-84386_t